MKNEHEIRQWLAIIDNDIDHILISGKDLLVLPIKIAEKKILQKVLED